MMLSRVTRIACMLMIFACYTACEDFESNDLTAKDQDFMNTAARMNRAQMDLGQLALEKSQTRAVKDFGQSLVNDQQIAQNDLRIAIDGKEVTFPDELDAEHQRIRNRMLVLDGFDFDTLYMNTQVRDHQLLIKLYDGQIKNGNNKKMKEYASTYLPKVKLHAQQAATVAAQLQ